MWFEWKVAEAMEENVWINKEACLDGPKKGYPRDSLERHAVPYGNRQKVSARSNAYLGNLRNGAVAIA